MINRGDIDNKFVKILEEKVSRYKKSEPARYKEVINIDTLLNAGKYLDTLMPQSKYREYKYQILEFIDTLEKEHGFSKKEIVALQQRYLSDLVIYLRSDHSFEEKHRWFWSGVFNLTLDVIFILLGIAKYYFYIPIFTIIAVARNVSKLKRAKKEGRYIDF